MRGPQLVSAFRNADCRLPGNRPNTNTHMPASWAVTLEWHEDERMRVEGGRKRDTVFAHDCMKPCNIVTGTNSVIIFYWESCSRSIFSLSKERYDIKKPATTQCAWNREQRASSQTMWSVSHAWYKRRLSVLKTVQLPHTSDKRTSTVPWEDNAQLHIQHK